MDDSWMHTRGVKRSDLDQGPKIRGSNQGQFERFDLDQGPKVRSIGIHDEVDDSFSSFDAVKVPSKEVASFEDIMALSNPLSKQPSAKLVATTVEPLPDWIEKYSSFYTSTPPNRLMEQFLPSILSDLAFDFETIGPCQIQIVGPRFCCVAQIFQAKEEFVVEFQRRSGDVCSFTAFYRAVLGKLGPVVTRSFVSNASILPPRALAPPDLSLLDVSSLLDDLEEDTQDDGVVLHQLFEMAQTNMLDVEREAFQELSALSASPRTRAQLIVQIDLVVRTVSNLLSKPSPDEMCVGSAISLLANLSTTGSSQMGPAMQPPLLRQLFVLATSPTTLMTRATVRAALATLAGLSNQPKTAKAMSAVSQSYMSTIRKFVSDDRLKGSALALVSNLA